MRYTSLLLTAMLAGGCATVVNGMNQDVNVLSMPAGAKVYVDGDYMGDTPVTVPMSRDEYHDVRVQMKGYDDFQETIGRSWSPWVLANLCPLGPVSLAIGGGVDYVTGGAFTLAPTRIEADLRPVNGESPYAVPKKD